MTFPVSPRMKSLLEGNTLRFATLWAITRTDGVVLAFTDHDEPISHDIPQPYLPAGGFNTSARQRQEGLKSRNLEITGMLQSSAITNDDLRAGRYRDAEVVETLVDWMHPWMGAFRIQKYFIDDVTFDGEKWTAQLSGLSRRLRGDRGFLFTRNCRHNLGDAGCKVNLAGITVNGTVTTATQRWFFVATGLIGAASQHYAFGLITWLTGLNAGLKSEVRFYDSATGGFNLQLPLPFDIVATDTFTVYPGCNKTLTHCTTKFQPPGGGIMPPGNLVNFGGFPVIPGSDKLFETP